MTLTACGREVATRSALGAVPAAEARQAARLAKEPVLAVRSLGRFSTRADVRRVASVLARRIPLPAGGNFNGIQWEASDGALASAEIDAILEFNAACQWLRALRDGRGLDAARFVVGTVAQWPAFRIQGREGAALATAFMQALKGGGESQVTMLANCDASHAREIRFARGRRWQPSS
jgi:hypothetical protein